MKSKTQDLQKQCNDYPLYPELTERGKEEAQLIMDSFKPKIQNLVEEILSKLYTDVSMYVESDHWVNYRNALMDGFNNYHLGKKYHEYDFAQLRKAIYRNHKKEIINDLNQDLVKENQKLKERLEMIEWERLIGR